MTEEQIGRVQALLPSWCKTEAVSDENRKIMMEQESSVNPDQLLVISESIHGQFHVDMLMREADWKLPAEILKARFVAPAVNCLAGAVMELEWPGMSLSLPRRQAQVAANPTLDKLTEDEERALYRRQELVGA